MTIAIAGFALIAIAAVITRIVDVVQSPDRRALAVARRDRWEARSQDPVVERVLVSAGE